MAQDFSIMEASKSHMDDCDFDGCTCNKRFAEKVDGSKPDENMTCNAPGHFETKYEREIVWRNVALFSILHAMAVFGAYCLFFKAKWATWLWVIWLHYLGGIGITIGAHRLWSHRSFKATKPLRLFLMICNSIAVQNHAIEWSRDHRVHHKFSETDADPHNAKRGLFFSHMGWLMVRKHPEVKRRGATVDVSDLEADPILAFQKRHYISMALLCSVVVPTLVPKLLWGESLLVAYFTAAILRYVYTLHMTWTVNSLAHMFGYRPYDKYINPRQCLPSNLATLGEGWHNYHHTFPQDYRASEFPWRINLSTIIIDFFAAIGWAYDRKTIPQELVEKRKKKTGE